MRVTTTVTFIPSNPQELAIPVDMATHFRATPLKILDMSLDLRSPDGTYVVRHEVDAPQERFIDVPFPTAARLATLANAQADALTILDPITTEFFPPLNNFYPRILQRIKDAVDKATTIV